EYTQPSRNRNLAGEYVAWLYSTVEYLPSAHRVHYLRHQWNGRNESTTVRSGGIGAGAGCRMAHRIQFDEIPDVHDGRIRQYDRSVCAGDNPVPRWMEWSNVRASTGSNGSPDFLVRA